MSYNSRNTRSRGGNSRRNNTRRTPDYSVYIKAAKPIALQEYKVNKPFSEMDLHGHIQKVIQDKGFKNPTPIQDQSIEPLLAGRDVIGIANTGTGKTAAFLIPLVHKLMNDNDKKVCILAPTRELAEQINRELKDFIMRTRLYSTLLVGGVPIRFNLKDLKRRVNFVVATPGRVLDLIDRGALKMNEFEHIVLDEMDQMLDMGFIDDIREILSCMPETRHSLFFSATINNEIETIAKEMLKDPIHISVTRGKTTDNVEQNIIKTPGGAEKERRLIELLKTAEVEKALLFDKTKSGVDHLEFILRKAGINAIAIHGDKEMRERRQALKSFREDNCDVLIATNVAARGLDIKGVTHVINYDTPENYDDYIHRIGRAGRADNIGYALTFVE
jgi:ATP-dependent RNA helicase RhlE